MLNEFIIRFSNLLTFTMATTSLGDAGRSSNNQEYLIEKYHTQIGDYGDVENKTIQLSDILILFNHKRFGELLTEGMEEYVGFWGNDNYDLILFNQSVNAYLTSDGKSMGLIDFICVLYEKIHGDLCNIHSTSKVDLNIHPVLVEIIKETVEGDDFKYIKESSSYRDYKISKLLL